MTATVPQLRRQVPDWWREFFPWPVAAFLYGAGLGVGFFTYLSHGTLVVVALAALASGDPLVGAAIVRPFGLVRGLSAARAARVRSQQESQRLVDRLAAVARGPSRARERPRAVAVAAYWRSPSAVRADDGWGAFATAGPGARLRVGRRLEGGGPRRAWRRTLAAHGLPRGVESGRGVRRAHRRALVPLFVAAGWTRAAGAWALLLLVVFTAEAARAWRRFGPQVPAGASAGASRCAPRALLRNAALAALALVVVVRPPPPPVLSWPGSPGAGRVPAGGVGHRRTRPGRLHRMDGDPMARPGHAARDHGRPVPPCDRRCSFASSASIATVVADSPSSRSGAVVPRRRPATATTRRGLLDVRRVRLAHEGGTEVTVITFDTLDRRCRSGIGGTPTSSSTPSGGADAEYFVVVRSTGPDLQASLWRDRRDRRDVFLRNVKVRRKTYAGVSVAVPIKSLDFGRSPRVLLLVGDDLVHRRGVPAGPASTGRPNEDAVEQWRPGMSPSPSPSPDP